MNRLVVTMCDIQRYKKIGITIIPANSLQAKKRIEMILRLFQD